MVRGASEHFVSLWAIKVKFLGHLGHIGLSSNAWRVVPPHKDGRCGKATLQIGHMSGVKTQARSNLPSLTTHEEKAPSSVFARSSKARSP